MFWIYFFSIAACNRTYFGEVGKTYDLELHRPREGKLPYFCKLNLTAGGGHFGDIVQVGIFYLNNFLKSKFLFTIYNASHCRWVKYRASTMGII